MKDERMLLEREATLLERAREGDKAAFEDLVAPWRGRLFTSCHQILGSTLDAEEALQETMLRAWRGIGRFEGRSALGTWLESIAVNRCLSALRRGRDRSVPIDTGPPPAFDRPGAAGATDTWAEPLPDQPAGSAAPPSEPAARYELRESVELAFIAAMNHLSANQRAALLLRDVFGFSAKEAASALDTTAASVTSALQRARRRLEVEPPSRSRQAALRALGDEDLTVTVERLRTAWEAADIETVVEMLSAEATFAMAPPLRRHLPAGGGLALALAAGDGGMPEFVSSYGWDDAVARFLLELEVEWSSDSIGGRESRGICWHLAMRRTEETAGAR